MKTMLFWELEKRGTRIDFETPIYLLKLIFINLFKVCGACCRRELWLPSHRYCSGQGWKCIFTSIYETLSYLKSINVKPLDFLDKLYQNTDTITRKPKIYILKVQEVKIKTIMSSHRKRPLNRNKRRKCS